MDICTVVHDCSGRHRLASKLKKPSTQNLSCLMPSTNCSKAAKLVYGARNQDDSCLWEYWGKESWGNVLGNGNVLMCYLLSLCVLPVYEYRHAHAMTCMWRLKNHPGCWYLAPSSSETDSELFAAVSPKLADPWTSGILPSRPSILLQEHRDSDIGSHIWFHMRFRDLNQGPMLVW